MNRRLPVVLTAVLLLLFLLATSASAEVVSLRVVLTGRCINADGTEGEINLNGSFRVLTDGTEAGIAEAFGEALTLPSGERVRLVPMPETFDPGWDLTGAYLAPDLSAGGEQTVKVTLDRLAAGSAAGTEPTATPAPAAAEETAESAAESTPETAEETGTAEEPEPIGEPETAEEPDEEPEGTSSAPEATPTIPPYTAPQATPEPILAPLPEAENTGSLRILVFNDKNDNGEQGGSEPGIPGVTIYLLAGDGTPVASADTDAEGEVYFTNIPEGTYRTKAVLPSGWSFTHFLRENELTANAFQFIVEGEQESGNLEIRAGKEALQGCGIRSALTVSGFCWLDETADGLYKSGEAMLPGVRITMERDRDHLFYETVSGEDGSWILDRVRPGQYTLTAYAPDGMMFAKYTRNPGTRSIITKDGVTKASVSMNLNDKVSRKDQAIGFAWSGEVFGRCYVDENYNGLYDEGEAPMPKVKVTLMRSNNDEEFAVTFSDEEGMFSLKGLRGGNYKVRAVMPEDGSTFTKVEKSDPLGNRFQSRPDRRENFWPDFQLSDAEKREIAIGGIYPATVKGTVYMDDDFSADQSGSEKIISGFQVSLVDAAGNVAATDKTSIKGVYELTGLVPGDYTFSVTAMKGYAFTRAGEGNVILNLTGGEGTSEPFHVNSGDHLTGLDIGMIRPGTVSGTVFADRNDNGLQDAGEEGLAGVTVRLMAQEEDGGSEAFAAAVGADGRFVFDAVMPGEYYLQYILPEDAVFARVTAGGNTIGDGVSESFTMNSGDVREVPLCGALTLGKITGVAFRDHNGDGILDEAGEEKLSGMTLTLIPTREELEEITAVSGEDGSFALTGIRPDSWTLRLSCPEGMVLSRADYLTLPLTAGRGEQRKTLEAAMGARWENQLLGAVMPAALRGQIWLDENNNGLFDEGEQTPSGYVLTVLDESTGTIFDSPVTDGEGRFSAAGMIPGSFTLSMALDSRTLPPKEGDSVFTEAEGALVLTGLALSENETREGLLLGLVRLTDISGKAWIDRGAGPEALSAVLVSLTDGEENVLSTAVTDENGEYLFEKLMPGDYRLEASVPEGCVLIEPGDPRLGKSARSVITHAVNREGSSDAAELKMDQPWTGMDIGCVLPGRLGDYCWVDLNRDGLQAAGEPGLAGVRIELMRDGETIAETVTNDYGYYRFPDLYPAEYVLKVHAPAEVTPTAHRTDIPMIASVLDETRDGEENIAYSHPVTVQSNRDLFDADLGFVCRKEGVLPEGAGIGKEMTWK